jgi:hypothetical protein
MKDYGFADLARTANAQGETPLDIAGPKGEEFAGVFGDMKTI